jgi:hypothetical protein
METKTNREGVSPETHEDRFYAPQDTTCERCSKNIYKGDIVTVGGTHFAWVCEALTRPPAPKSDLERELEPFGYAWQDEQRERGFTP